MQHICPSCFLNSDIAFLSFNIINITDTERLTKRDAIHKHKHADLFCCF